MKRSAVWKIVYFYIVFLPYFSLSHLVMAWGIVENLLAIDDVVKCRRLYFRIFLIH